MDGGFSFRGHGSADGAIKFGKVVMRVVDCRDDKPDDRMEEMPLLDVTDYQSAERVVEDCFPAGGKKVLLELVVSCVLRASSS